MTSQTGQQIITIHILPNISKSKENQTMKFGQLIENEMRNIFLEKSYAKCGGEASNRCFIKNQTSVYLWVNSLSCYKVCFHCLSKSRSTKYVKNKVLTTCFYLISSLFEKQRGLQLVSLPHFPHDSPIKLFLILYLIN